MNTLSYRANLWEYEDLARALFEALTAGDESSAWRFKWEHPTFRGQTVDDVRAATLDLNDAKLVIARGYGFEGWSELAEFAEAVQHYGPVARFEAAVEAVISGEADALRQMLRQEPELCRARSVRRHHVTLLHYIAANGVEGCRQKTPPNAVEIAHILLEAGADPDALADMYDHRCTTMSMLVSSCHPANAGLQIALAETLIDHGAAIEGVGTNWQSAVKTALAFGYGETAETLARRGGPVIDLATAAGLGRIEETKALLDGADVATRHAALALASQHGRTEAVGLLLDAGEDPNRFNPDGYHAHTTPLHQAACGGHLETVRLLVERGARLDIQDSVYNATPLGWAVHCEKPEVEEYLREYGAAQVDRQSR